MWWQTAKVGDKVVCLDPTWGADGPLQRMCCPNLPIKGRVYTIRTIESGVAVIARGEEVFIRLAEISNPAICGKEPVFFACKFRPVQPRSTETGMAIIRKILDQAPVKEPA